MSERRKRLVLLDTHAIIHRAYHALPDFVSSKGEPTGAIFGLASMIIKIVSELKPNWIVAAYDLPKPTYRHEAYKEYKAGRAKTDEELIAQIKTSRHLLSAVSIPIYEKEGFEADDILGSIVEQMKNRKDVEIIIASGDMDTLQLVKGREVMVYTLKKGISDTVLYNEDLVFKRFGFSPQFIPDYKGLSGDPSDNIIGVKGIGQKTATVLIQKFGTIENIYAEISKSGGLEKFTKAGIKPRVIDLLKQNKEEAEFSKLLATIRKDAPINFVLPDEEWCRSVDIQKAEELFLKLEFRTMTERLRKAISDCKGESVSSLKNYEIKEDKDVFYSAQKQASLSETDWENNKENEMVILEAGVLLWLINSAITNPSWQEIKTYTKKENPIEARDFLLMEVRKQGLLDVYEKIERPLIPIVSKMNKRGVAVDVPYLKQLGNEYLSHIKDLEQKIWALAGLEFNINSPKQISEVLFEKLGLKLKNHKKTSTGTLSTRESELQKLADSHPIVPLILQHRELSKLLSTYIDNLIPLVEKDGRLRAKFIQTGTTTGRMSSESPNLQNIPNHTELGLKIRRAFKADPGNILLSFDYSQMELRIAAFLSGDKNLIEIFKRGDDVHSAVASLVFDVPIETVDKEMRRRAKVINFGVMYGMGINALKTQLGTSKDEAQKFYDEYFKKFSGLADYLEKIKKETAQKGYTETIFGRRRYFEGISSKLPFIRSAAERMAINAPIQGTGADIIKLAMVAVDDWIRNKKLGLELSLILQVHDELVYESKKDIFLAVAPEIKKIMESQIDMEKTKGVPLAVGVSCGERWGEMSTLY